MRKSLSNAITAALVDFEGHFVCGKVTSSHLHVMSHVTYRLLQAANSHFYACWTLSDF